MPGDSALVVSDDGFAESLSNLEPEAERSGTRVLGGYEAASSVLMLRC
jgi:hypothetical protein